MFGGKEEEMKEIDFEYMQSDISKDQYNRLDKIAKVLEKKPELKVELIQVNNIEQEKEYTAVFELKKQFYFSKKGANIQDSISLELRAVIKQIDMHDSAFVDYVNSKSVGEDVLTPMHEKCRKIIGEPQLQKDIIERMEYRNNLVANYLHIVKQVPLERMRVINMPDQKTANSQTVSKYLINYFIDDEQNENAVNDDANK